MSCRATNLFLILHEISVFLIGANPGLKFRNEFNDVEYEVGRGDAISA